MLALLENTDAAAEIPMLWLILGFTGQALFGSRFVVQWIVTEKARRVVVPLVVVGSISYSSSADPLGGSGTSDPSFTEVTLVEGPAPKCRVWGSVPAGGHCSATSQVMSPGSCIRA